MPPAWKEQTWPDVLLYEHWPPRNHGPSPPPSPTRQPSAPHTTVSHTRHGTPPRVSDADLASLRTSVACIFRMHVDGDPAAQHLHVTAWPPGRRTNSSRAVGEASSGWPLYVAPRDAPGGGSSAPIVTVDVVADESAAQFAARIRALTARRAREILLLCPAGLPELPDAVLHIAKDRRRDSARSRRARHRMACAAIGRRTRTGSYSWAVAVRGHLLQLRELMVAAWVEHLTTAPSARALAGLSGYSYASMFCATVSLAVRGRRCEDKEGLVERARGMARTLGMPWSVVLRSSSVARVERMLCERPVVLIGDVDRFCRTHVRTA